MVLGVVRQLIERDVIAIDIQEAATRTPLDAIRIDLPGIAQNEFGTAAGQGNAVEGLDLATNVRLLGQDHFAIAQS
ncbi:Uncharacterised protein [Achromobacter ruhlandii]|nr:Uncharacterised protein [Achromobacter ruhlandii]CUJ72196.1 Uncharacterised protein [Achromobacter ruhlandii]